MSDASVETLVQVWGAKPPFENATLVREQLWLSHLYRNVLAEIEGNRRAVLREWIERAPSVIEAQTVATVADAESLAAVTAIEAARAATRKRIVPDELLARADAAKAVRIQAFNALRDARTAEMKTPETVAFIDNLKVLQNGLINGAYALSKLFWGTKVWLAKSAQLANQSPLWDLRRPLDVCDPHFKSWTGEGALAMQIQSTRPLTDLATDTRFRIEPLSPEYEAKLPQRTSTRAARRMVAALRVGSNGRDPVWARFRVAVHRELPENARITWAVVQVHRRGPREEWNVHVSLNMSACVRVPQHGTGVVAIDVGWRDVDDPLRVAKWGNDRDEIGGLRVTPEMIASLRYCERLRGIRDDAFDVERDRLVAWLRTTTVELPAWLRGPVDDRDAPRWVRDGNITTLAQYKSCARLSSVAKWWGVHRFEGDELIYKLLEAWRYHDHHLWEWECAQREKSLRDRKQFYRNAAAMLARTHDTAVLEAFDKRQTARRPEPEDADGGNPNARSNRQLVAVSEFCGAVVQAFQSRSGKAVEMPCAHTTHDCAAIDPETGVICGHRNTWDQAAELTYACERCGASWDQDDNAWRNLLARYRERPDDAQKVGTARKRKKTGVIRLSAQERRMRGKLRKKERAAAAAALETVVPTDSNDT